MAKDKLSLRFAFFNQKGETREKLKTWKQAKETTGYAFNKMLEPPETVSFYKDMCLVLNRQFYNSIRNRKSRAIQYFLRIDMQINSILWGRDKRQFNTYLQIHFNIPDLERHLFEFFFEPFVTSA